MGIKLFALANKECAYLVIPEGSQIIIDETNIRQRGNRFILITIT